MSQRTKSGETARLSVVPAGATSAPVMEPKQIQNVESESRRTPQDIPAPAAKGPAPVSPEAPPKTTSKAGRKRILMTGVAAVALAAAAWFGFDYATIGRFMVSTDDAYVRAYNTT